MIAIDIGLTIGFTATAESVAYYPLAAAILAGAEEKEIQLVAVESFQLVTGKGVTGTLLGKQVAIENAALMSDLDASFVPMQQKAESLQKQGKTVIYIAFDKRFAGLIAVADPIKDSTAEAIQQLKQEGIKIVMVTGNNQTTAAAVARTLGVDFEADVLPKKKAQVVKKLKVGGAIVSNGRRRRK